MRLVVPRRHASARAVVTKPTRAGGGGGGGGGGGRGCSGGGSISPAEISSISPAEIGSISPVEIGSISPVEIVVVSSAAGLRADAVPGEDHVAVWIRADAVPGSGDSGGGVGLTAPLSRCLLLLVDAHEGRRLGRASFPTGRVPTGRASFPTGRASFPTGRVPTGRASFHRPPRCRFPRCRVRAGVGTMRAVVGTARARRASPRWSARHGARVQRDLPHNLPHNLALNLPLKGDGRRVTLRRSGRRGPTRPRSSARLARVRARGGRGRHRRHVLVTSESHVLGTSESNGRGRH
jgi:hypothetical protein